MSCDGSIWRWFLPLSTLLPGRRGHHCAPLPFPMSVPGMRPEYLKFQVDLNLWANHCWRGLQHDRSHRPLGGHCPLGQLGIGHLVDWASGKNVDLPKIYAESLTIWADAFLYRRPRIPANHLPRIGKVRARRTNGLDILHLTGLPSNHHSLAPKVSFFYLIQMFFTSDDCFRPSVADDDVEQCEEWVP